MLDQIYAVTGDKLRHNGVVYSIVEAGIRNDKPHAKVDPPNSVVEEAIISNIRKSMPLPLSLDEVQNELA